jgi:hypothetical protein
MTRSNRPGSSRKQVQRFRTVCRDGHVVPKVFQRALRHLQKPILNCPRRVDTPYHSVPRLRTCLQAPCQDPARKGTGQPGLCLVKVSPFYSINGEIFRWRAPKVISFRGNAEIGFSHAKSSFAGGIAPRSRTRDEGRPLGAGLQEQVPNYLKLLR